MLDGKLAPRPGMEFGEQPSRAQIAALMEKFPTGLRVKLVELDDNKAPAPGSGGVVTEADDWGRVMVRWDNGESIAAVFGTDKIEPDPQPGISVVKHSNGQHYVYDDAYKKCYGDRFMVGEPKPYAYAKPSQASVAGSYQTLMGQLGNDFSGGSDGKDDGHSIV